MEFHKNCYPPPEKEIEYGKATETAIGILFHKYGADNYALFNEFGELLHIVCHPMDKKLAEDYVKKNLPEFKEKLKKIQGENRTYEPFQDPA